MKSMNLKLTILTAAILSFTISSALAGEYSRLAAGLAQSAKMQGISKIALGEFSMHGSTEKNEAAYAKEQLANALFKEKGIEVIDPSLVGDTQGLEAAAWTKKAPKKLRPGALIKGSVFKTNSGVSLVVKLVDLESGKVLDSSEIISESRFDDMPEIPALAEATAPDPASFPSDFRDALTDTQGADCKTSFKRLSAINENVVELKAKYWAAKMKEPGFSYSTLNRNPGSELKDYQTKQKFYELLGKYYDKDEDIVLPESQITKLKAFMAKEASVLDECGIN